MYIYTTATRRSSAEALLDKMREQLSIIEKKKADRRKLMTLPMKTISRWASSAASRIFGTGLCVCVCVCSSGALTIVGTSVGLVCVCVSCVCARA